MTFEHAFTILRPIDVPVTNPDKVFFPERGLTKGDLVAYYIGMADHVLPHLRRRPFHMKRFPNGVDGEFFHQKRVPAKHPAFVDEVFVQFPSGHSTVFAIVDNVAALAWVANLGCILHTWSSRVPEIEKPDYC
jgi:DNA primase